MLKWKYRQKKRFFYVLMKLPKPLDWISTFFDLIHNRIHMFFWKYWAKLKFAEISFTEEEISPGTVLPKVIKEVDSISSQFSHCISCGEFILSAVHTCHDESDYYDDFDDHDQECDFDDDFFDDCDDDFDYGDDPHPFV